MRCEKCGKNFDEKMYSGICPKCGYFNNRQADYDVSKYFSATFDEGEKISTNAQAAKQHEQLHKMYDSSNMHKAGAGSHEKLHEKYDKQNMHSQGQRPLSGYQQTPVNKQSISPGKPNPYQTSQPMVTGNKYQAGQSGVYGQNRTYQAGQAGTYGQNKYGKATAYSEEKKKNLVTPICIAIAVLAIAGTAVGCQLKKQSLKNIYDTLDFEKETVQAGESFEINERRFVVERAKVVDTSALSGMPEGEKLVAVSVEILPTEVRGSDNTSGDVYVSDGSSYKMPLERYTVTDILYDGDYSMGDDILSEYSFYGYISADGKNGECYFFVDDDAEEITISFEEGSKKEGIYVLHRRVSVSLQLEED